MSERTVNNDREAKAPKVDERRRTLMRASAAAPLIATLQPGSALALSSNTADCAVDYSPSEMKFEEQNYDPAADPVARLPVEYFYIPNNGGGNGVPATGYYRINGAYYGQNGQPAYPNPDPALSGSGYTRTYAYVLRYFDLVTGDEYLPFPLDRVEGGAYTINKTPVIGSCMASMLSSMDSMD